MYRYILKKVLDLVLSIIGFILLFPFFITICIILFFSNDGQPFFFQARPGKNGKIFKIVKFKTMNDKKDSDGNLLPDYQRITKTGNFIRKNSLDEIPQLLNVIKGDMSIVGPRPLLISYLPLYNKVQARRHDVKPGITGWAQVNGRNAISWEQKFEYDVWYVDHISFKTDVTIILMTISKVFKREGISASENVTMEMFKGTPEEL